MGQTTVKISATGEKGRKQRRFIGFEEWKKEREEEETLGMFCVLLVPSKWHPQPMQARTYEKEFLGSFLVRGIESP